MTISTDKLNKKYMWCAPSNIALVKYWGKKANQIPCNPSLSMTLKKSVTKTSLKLVPRKQQWIEVYLEEKITDSFVPKIETFLKRLGPEWNFLGDYSLEIHSHNTFPHSSGMASSASSLAALSLCLKELRDGFDDSPAFFKDCSEMARLGSGSACRSLYSGMSIWGNDGENGHDEYAIPFDQFHSKYKGMQDTVLIISSEKKSVSSSQGHALLENNPFANSRFEQASAHHQLLKKILLRDDFEVFAEIVEAEALSLHAMMMTSTPNYLLMKSGTLSVIEKVRQLRKSGLEICFTLDAGPNVHLLYPFEQKDKILPIIDMELGVFCENGKYIVDEMGEGPNRIIDNQ